MVTQNEQKAWEHYFRLIKNGFFKEMYPNLSGVWQQDKDEFIKDFNITYDFINDDTPTTPAHYGGANNTYEAIKVIEAWELNFSLGNVVKYISRAGKKENTTALQDLLKAKKYLEFEIAKHEALHR